MKKNLLCAGIAIAAMTACTNDQQIAENLGEAISFNVAVPHATRVAPLTLNNLTAFDVVAIKEDAQKVLFTETATKDNTSSIWNTRNPQYWPPGANSALKFFAYAPTDVTTVAIDQTTQKINDFTPASEAANQKDLIVAVNNGTKATHSTTGVPLFFKHALSQIEVQAKNTRHSDIKVEILGVKLVKIKNSGTFTFPTVETANGVAIAGTPWQVGNTMTNYLITGTDANNPVELGQDHKNIMFDAGNWMLIPQQLQAWNPTEAQNPNNKNYLSVLCRISKKNADGSYTQLYPAAAGKFAYSAVGIGQNWQPGKKYTYKLNFFGDPNGGGAGNQDPDNINNNDPNNPNVDPNPGVEPGKPVLGNPITFTLEVEDWGDELVEIGL